jgi:hypothetical protein
VAGIWLFVLGATGIVLDHDEWRWVRQATVSESWLSPRVARLLPATRLRHIAAESDQNGSVNRWLGASERGLWWSDDSGESWHASTFPDGAGTPQVFGFVRTESAGLDGIYLATDDGIWVTRLRGEIAEPVALPGAFVNSMTPGSKRGELVGVVAHDRVFRLNVDTPQSIEWRAFDEVVVDGLPPDISLYRLVFDLHFGYALGNRTVATLINDFGGLAFMLLALTGFLYWWFPSRWRTMRSRMSPARKRGLLTWLYRGHAPVVGLLAVIPIAYLALTAIPLGHVAGFGTWAHDVQISRDRLPGVYAYHSLRGELNDVVAYSGEPDRLSVSTRFGILHSRDGGDTWKRDARLPAGSGVLFRSGEASFFSDNAGGHFVRPRDDVDWRPLTGIATILSDALRLGDDWYLKNSRGFNAGTFAGGFETAEIGYKPQSGATLYLFLIDIHVGLIIHPEFKWVNDVASILALLLAVSGPVLWWRRKWL